MSIKDFIETMGMDATSEPLPTPYIESVEIYDNYMDVKLSVYVHIPKQDYGFDQGAEFLETYDDIRIIVQTIYDRNSNTDFCGIAPYETSNNFQKISRNAWTQFTKNGISPIRSFFPMYSDDAYDAVGPSEFPEIVTNFVFNPDNVDFTDLFAYVHSGPGYYMFEYYKLPSGEFADYNKIVAYAKELCRETRTDCADTDFVDVPGPVSGLDLDAELKVIYIDLINQAILKNHYDLIIQLFGHITFNAVDDPEPINVPGLIPNMQIVKLHADIVPIYAHFRDVSSNVTDILEREDGSAILKLSLDQKIPSEAITPAVYNRQKNIGIKKMGLAAFCAPWGDLLGQNRAEILPQIVESVITQNTDLIFWENSISKINHVLVIENDEVTHEPTVVYRDSNDVIYQTAMRSLDGAYYDPINTPFADVVSSMTSIPTSMEVSADTEASFQYALFQGVNSPIEILPLLNKYRKAFPDKSTVTPAGLFYNAFAENLYNTNTALQRGTKLFKGLIRNPVVKDFRTHQHGSQSPGSHVGSDYEAAYQDIFKLENALWSRYTEVTGDDGQEYSEMTEGTVIVGGDWETTNWMRSGGQFNYNFIDHGFMFFNYERALKTTSVASKYLDIPMYEKYFGSVLFNELFQMKKCYLKAYWGDPDDVHTSYGADSVSPIGTMVLTFPSLSDQWVNQTTNFYQTDLETRGNSPIHPDGLDAAVNVDKFDVVVENQLGYMDTDAHPDLKFGFDLNKDYIGTESLAASGELLLTNNYGGADAMTKSKEYSFLALRGFSPITTKEGINPYHVGETFYDKLPLNYRLACIEFQKCDAFAADEAKESLNFFGDVLEEVDESTRGGAFVAAILVEDRTHQVVVDLKSALDASIAVFEEYRNAALDTCSFNESTGFFNQFFIDTVLTIWPDNHSAPYFRAIVELVIFEDIFYSTFGGDEVSALEEIKKLVQNVSPNTGTVSGINVVYERLLSLQEIVDSIVDEYGLEVSAAGHIYGSDPYFDEDYDSVEVKFSDNYNSPDRKYVSTDAGGDMPAGTGTGTPAFRPDAGYDNYPLYPLTMTGANSQYVIVVPDEDLVEDLDVTDGLNTIVEGLIEDYELSLDIEQALVDAAMQAFAEMEMRLGLDSWRGHLMDNIDILENLAWTVGSTFPDAQDYLNGFNDSYMDAFGNSGADAAYNTVYMTENFSTVANVMGGLMSYLNSASPAELVTLVPMNVASMFGAGSFSMAATVNDYLSGGSAGLQQIQGFAEISMMTGFEMNNFFL